MIRPLRVAFVTDWYSPRRGGIESQLSGLAKALAGRQVTVKVLTSFPGPTDCEGVSVERLPVRLIPGAMIAVSPGLVAMLRRALSAGGYDVVHAHPSIVAPVCLAGVIAARQLGLPVVLSFHSSMRALTGWLRLLDRMTGWTNERVTLTAVSEYIRAQVRRINPARDVLLLPNGHDHEFWRPPDAVAGHQSGAPLRIVTAMRLERTKRPLALVDILYRAQVALGKGGQKLELVVAGDGSHASALSGAAERAGVGGQLHMAGWLGMHDLRALYWHSDAFVLPSTKESFGIAAMEARAAGLPVLARSGTGLADYIRPGLDGVLAKTDGALADALAQLARDASLLATMSGPRPQLDRYAWDKVAAQHQALYGDVAHPIGRSGPG